jgi:hypothetical protein
MNQPQPTNVEWTDVQQKDPMSKGPGKQQRRILATLEKVPCFYLAELSVGKPRAELVALNRAAWKLYDAGKIGIFGYMCGAGDWGRRNMKMLITRAGYPRPSDRPEATLARTLAKC